MIGRWRRGERPLVEEYLARHPELAKQPEAAIDLIYEEFCLRQEHGSQLPPDDLVRRFPQWRTELLVLLDCHQLFEPPPQAPRFPVVGETVGDFRLLAELGRGIQGRVFLASQPSLADRPVVLKLTPLAGREHLSLARLQHTHIMPLYAMQDDPGRDLRALCMPYCGGATLAWLLKALRDCPPEQRSGQDLLSRLGQAQATAPITMPVRGPACQFLGKASYVDAVCWIGACLADALRYAHERNLVHLDLKPSNVLLAADGQPLLLDFHLARESILPEGPIPEWMGGTPLYMPPEQRAALRAVRGGRRVPAAVDGRADLYALGRLLYEALAGRLPDQAEMPMPPLYRSNPQVSVGLSDLIGKCLAGNPGDRYASAALVASDLRRHLANLPLHGVRNRSPAERWRKWRRRRPLALAALCLVLGVATAGSLALAYVGQQLHKAQAALDEGRELREAGLYGEAAGAFKRGLTLAEDLPASHDLVQELGSQLRLVERARAARELHLLVDRILVLYGEDSFPTEELKAVEAHCRNFWETRTEIMERLKPGLVPQQAQQTQTDLLELAILWTDVRIRLASSSEAGTARGEALRVLAEAEETFGPSCILYRERQRHLAALGRTQEAQEAACAASRLLPRTPWEHYALGRSFLQSGNLLDAAGELERAVDLEPQGLWLNFYKGKCAFQLARYEDAVIAFTACVALAPENVGCFYNRGLAFAKLGRPQQALQDYDHALRLAPSLAPAVLNRGLLHYQEKRYPHSVNDLQQALKLGIDPTAVHYDLALVYLAQGDRAAALQSLQAALEHNPRHKEARALQERLQRMR
jgi:serine/threonine protein kinase/tetratricopeptide (TPR) repeat protein